MKTVAAFVMNLQAKQLVCFECVASDEVVELVQSDLITDVELAERKRLRKIVCARCLKEL